MNHQLISCSGWACESNISSSGGAFGAGPVSSLGWAGGISAMPAQRRYVCSFCARAFSRSEHRARHERSHTKEKPFACDRCPSAFVRRDLLQRHLRTVHSKERPTHKEEYLEDQSLSPAPSCSSSTVTSPPRSPHMITTSTSPTDNSQLYTFSEQNIISLLTLSKKFNRLSHLNLRSKVSSFFLTWGTISNQTLPIVQNNQILHLDETSSLLYALLCFGAADSSHLDDALTLMNKAWLLILKNAHSPDILQPLTIISHVYLTHHTAFKKLENNDQLVPIEIVLEYLDHTLLRLAHQEHTFDHWYVYLILSKYASQFNKKPPMTHQQLFLSKPLPGTTLTLSQGIDTLAKSPSLPTADPLCSNSLVMGLSNELQCLKFGQPSQLKDGLLHNAIIMANKSFYTPAEDFHPNTNVNNLMMISKRNLLLNCPLKLQDLLMEYINVPRSEQHWNLLTVTLKEFNMDQTQVSMDKILELSNEREVSASISNYINSLSINTVNNNLGLIALPLLFLGFIQDSSSTPLHISTIIETYLTLFKLFTTLNSYPSLLNNAIVQSMAYLISEMGTTTPEHIHQEIHSLLNTPTTSVSPQFIQYFEHNLTINLRHHLRGLPQCTISGIEAALRHTVLLSSPIQSSPSSPRDTHFHTMSEKIRLPPINFASAGMLTAGPLDGGIQQRPRLMPVLAQLHGV